MSWTTIRKKLHGNRAAGGSVRVSLRLTRNKPHFFIGLTLELLRELEWAIGDYIVIQAGGGNHKGLMRLSKGSKDIGYKLTGSRTYPRISVPVWDGCPTTVQPAAVVRHDVVNGGLEIEMPTLKSEPEPELKAAPTPIATPKTSTEPRVMTTAKDGLWAGMKAHRFVDHPRAK